MNNVPFPIVAERVELHVIGGRLRRATRRAELRAGAAAERRDGRGGAHQRARRVPHAARAPARAGGRRARAPRGGAGRGRRGRHRARRAPQRRRRQPRARQHGAALLRHRPHLHGRPADGAPLRPRQGRRARPPGDASAAGHATPSRLSRRPQGGLRLQDGARQLGRRPLVAHLAGQLARPPDRRAQVRRHDAPPVRVLGGLVPDRTRLAARVPRVRGAADRRELLPDRGRRVRVRRLPRGAAAPGREADRDAAAGGDPRRWAAQVLRAARQGLPAGTTRQDQDARAVHVLEVLHRLPRAGPAACQAGGLPAEPLRRQGGGGVKTQVSTQYILSCPLSLIAVSPTCADDRRSKYRPRGSHVWSVLAVQIPDPAAQRGARVDGVPDGARAAADAGADRGAGVPRAGGPRRADAAAHVGRAGHAGHAGHAGRAGRAGHAGLLRVRVRRVRRIRAVRRVRRAGRLLRVLPAHALPRVTPVSGPPPGHA